MGLSTKRYAKGYFTWMGSLSHWLDRLNFRVIHGVTPYIWYFMGGPWFAPSSRYFMYGPWCAPLRLVSIADPKARKLRNRLASVMRIDMETWLGLTL